MACSGAAGVESTLWMRSMPSPSSTKSVKVPPVSTPSQKRGAVMKNGPAMLIKTCATVTRIRHAVDASGDNAVIIADVIAPSHRQDTLRHARTARGRNHPPGHCPASGRPAHPPRDPAPAATALAGSGRSGRIEECAGERCGPARQVPAGGPAPWPDADASGHVRLVAGRTGENAGEQA